MRSSRTTIRPTFLNLALLTLATSLALFANEVSAHVSLVDRDLTTNVILESFRNGPHSLTDPKGASDSLLVSEQTVPYTDTTATDKLLFGRSLQHPLGFSALEARANDEPLTGSEVATSTVRYEIEVRNEGLTPEQMHMSFHINPTLLHLYDQSVEGIGVPPGFAGFEQKAEIHFQIFGFTDAGGETLAWSWFARLSGGKLGADNFTLLSDPSHIGEPTRSSPAPTPASELDAEYDDFSAALDFGDLLPNTNFRMTYTISAQVSLRGEHDSGPNGGYAIGGDPFDLTGQSAGSDFIFTAGDFSTVPEPNSLALLECAGGLALAVRAGRRRSTTQPTA